MYQLPKYISSRSPWSQMWFGCRMCGNQTRTATTNGTFDVRGCIKFSMFYQALRRVTCEHANIPQLAFNNAMTEVYTSDYEHMNQSQDLAKDSFICLFVCYNNPETSNVRTLRVFKKDSTETCNFLLEQNSVSIFSQCG